MTQQFKLVSEADIEKLLSHFCQVEHQCVHLAVVSMFNSLSAAPDVAGEARSGFVAPDYKLRACLCGSYDVGAANGIAVCYKCGKSINGVDISTAIENWNEQNSPPEQPDRTAELEQILQDPENQPSQYGTIPISMYEARTAELQEQVLQLQDKVKRLVDSAGKVVNPVRWGVHDFDELKALLAEINETYGFIGGVV